MSQARTISGSKSFFQIFYYICKNKNYVPKVVFVVSIYLEVAFKMQSYGFSKAGLGCCPVHSELRRS